MPTTGANNGLKLADLTGVAYDDPKWEQLLDELTVNACSALRQTVVTIPLVLNPSACPQRRTATARQVCTATTILPQV